jgi:hypothetical protein
MALPKIGLQRSLFFLFAAEHRTAWRGGQMNKSLLDRSSQALLL